MRELRHPLLLPAAVMLASAAVLVGSAGPADAHTRTQETTNIDSRITSTPDLDDVTWTVHTGGLAIEVENRSDGILVIEGYDGEPYLRVGPDGVHENRRSPATFLNRERYDRVTLPPSVDPGAAPDWRAVSEEPRVVWHDHRPHWMSPQAPRFVAASGPLRLLMDLELVGPVGVAGEDAGTFVGWEIPVSFAGEAGYVRGELVWVDPPSPLPWLVLGGLLVLPALLGLRRRDAQDLVRPAAYVVLAVAIINGIHLVDDLVAFPADPLDELSGLLHTTIFLVAGAAGAWWVLRVGAAPLLALGVASGAVLYHQGLVHLPMLFASQFPTMWPEALVRLTIALGLLQAIPVALVLRAGLRASASSSDGAGAESTLAAGTLPETSPSTHDGPDATVPHRPVGVDGQRPPRGKLTSDHRSHADP